MHAKFQASRFNNKKKYPKVVDPLNFIKKIALIQIYETFKELTFYKQIIIAFNDSI